MLLRAVPVCYRDRSRADHIRSRGICDTPPDLRLFVGRRTSRELQRTMQEGKEQFCVQKRNMVPVMRVKQESSSFRPAAAPVSINLHR